MASQQFIEEMLNKRKNFVELIHAAFILETSVEFYLTRQKPTEKDLEWLAGTYPNSKIREGNDFQGGSFCNITPKL